MSDPSEQNSWTRPAATAVPKGGFFKDKVEQGRYGPIFPKTPACYGFSILAKVIPGREERFYEYAKNIEEAVAAQPDCLAVLKLHYLRWVLFPIKGDTYFMYQGIFDTDFDKYTEDAVNLLADKLDESRSIGLPVRREAFKVFEDGLELFGIRRIPLCECRRN